MANVGISFGSSTGGSGFDVATTVSSIMAAERSPEAAWQARTAALGKQDAVLTTLGSNLSSLSNSLSALSNFDGVFAAKLGGVSDSGVLAITSTASGATAGSHTITVQQLAQTSSQFSAAYPTAATFTGTVSVQVGSGAAKTVTLDSAGETVAAMAATINTAHLGVSATVVSDRNGDRLSLVSQTEGAAGEISFGGSATSAQGQTLSLTESRAGKDAQYTLDGIALTSATNSVPDALTGVRFQLLSVSANPITLQVGNDTASAASAVSDFVTAYNTLASAISVQEGKDASGAAQPLFGNPLIATLQEQLSSAFASGGGTSGTDLSKLGVAFNAKGQLTLDAAVLQGALTTNFQAAADFFQSAGNFGQTMTKVLNGLGSTGKGAIALASKQNSDEEGVITNETSVLEARLASYQTNLTAQLTTANQVLQSIPGRLNEINQIFAAITGYRNVGN